ncbi:MAG: type II CAAX prenyl endopeptidase Rce1 family protein [Eubacteriales bacterium]
MAAGVGYGTVLGFIRLKTKNCWATVLAHGVINFFMI